MSTHNNNTELELEDVLTEVMPNAPQTRQSSTTPPTPNNDHQVIHIEEDTLIVPHPPPLKTLEETRNEVPDDLNLESLSDNELIYSASEIEEEVLPDEAETTQQNSDKKWWQFWKKSNAKGGAVLSLERLEEFKMKSLFLEFELNRLYARFMEYQQLTILEGREVAAITRDHVLKFPELRFNPLKKRLADVLKINEVLTFDELVDSLQKLSINYPKPEKIKIAFEMFDFDNDQLISKNDLTKFLHTILNKAVCEQQELSEEDIDIIVENTMHEMSGSKDGYITFEQFKRVVDYENDIIQKFSIDF